MTQTYGWAPDPWGIHELRYFSGGKPTRLVRDGSQESYDEPPPGPVPTLPPAGPIPASPASTASSPTSAPATQPAQTAPSVPAFAPASQGPVSPTGPEVPASGRPPSQPSRSRRRILVLSGLAVLMVTIGVIVLVVRSGGRAAALSACSLLNTTQERALLDASDVRTFDLPGGRGTLPQSISACNVEKWPYTPIGDKSPPWMLLQLSPATFQAQNNDYLRHVAGVTEETIHGQTAWLVPIGSNMLPDFKGGPITGVSTYVLYAFKDGYEVKVQAFRTADTEATDKTAMSEMLSAL